MNERALRGIGPWQKEWYDYDDKGRKYPDFAELARESNRIEDPTEHWSEEEIKNAGLIIDTNGFRLVHPSVIRRRKREERIFVCLLILLVVMAMIGVGLGGGR